MADMLSTLKLMLQPKEILELTIWRDEADEEGMTFETVIERIMDGRYLVVPAPTVFAKVKTDLPLPIVVGALYGEGKSPYLFYPTLDAVETIKAKGFWLKLPGNMDVKTIQRRAFVRVKVKLPIVIAAYPETVAYTVDISGGGFQFISSQVFIQGSILQVQIQFNSELPPFWLKAVVVNSRENPLSKREEDAFSTSCQFQDLNEADQQRLVGECFRIELMDKRHLQG